MNDNKVIISQQDTKNQPSVSVEYKRPAAVERISLAELERRQQQDRKLDQRNDNLADIENLAGAQWTAIRENSKAPQGQGWQDRPTSIDDLTNHPHGIGLLCGQHSNNIILLDLDENASGFLERHPQLRNTLAIWTIDADGNATDRIKLAIRITDNLPKSSAHKSKDNSATFDTDVLSNHRQGVIWGPHPNGGEYRCNWRTNIIEMSFDELNKLWFERTGKYLKTAIPTPTATPKSTTKSEPAPAPTQQSENDSIFKIAKAAWTCQQVFRHFDLGEEREESDGQVRFLSNGGLIASGDKFYNFADEMGGNSIDAWHWCKTGEITNRDTKLAYRVALEMCQVAGVDPESIKPCITPEIDKAIDYIADFDITDDNLLSVALAVIKTFENENVLYAPISCANIALLAGIAKDTAAKKLSLLSPQGRERLLKSLKRRLRDAIKLNQIIDDDIDLAELLHVLPHYEADPLLEKIKHQPEKANEFIDNKIASIRKRVTKLKVDIERLETKEYPDLMTLKKCGNGILANEYELAGAKDRTHDPSSSVRSMRRIFRAISDNMSDDAFLRNMPRKASGRKIEVVELDSGRSVIANGVTDEDEDYIIASYGKSGLRIVSALLSADGQTLNQSDLASAIGKHPATVRTTINRMLCIPLGEHQRECETIITVDNSGKEKLITLADDWQQRLNTFRPYMTTSGVTGARQRRYAEERIERICDALPEVRSDELREKYIEILNNTRGFLNEFHPTPRVCGVTKTDRSEGNLSEEDRLLIEHQVINSVESERKNVVPLEVQRKIIEVLSTAIETDPVIEPVAVIEPVQVIETEVVCTRQSFVLDADGLYRALSRLADNYKSSAIEKFFFGWSRASKKSIARMVEDLQLDIFIKMELMNA